MVVLGGAVTWLEVGLRVWVEEGVVVPWVRRDMVRNMGKVAGWRMVASGQRALGARMGLSKAGVAGLRLIMSGYRTIMGGLGMSKAGSGGSLWDLAHTHTGEAQTLLLPIQLVLQVGQELACLDAVSDPLRPDHLLPSEFLDLAVGQVGGDDVGGLRTGVIQMELTSM